MQSSGTLHLVSARRAPANSCGSAQNSSFPQACPPFRPAPPREFAPGITPSAIFYCSAFDNNRLFQTPDLTLQTDLHHVCAVPHGALNGTTCPPAIYPARHRYRVRRTLNWRVHSPHPIRQPTAQPSRARRPYGLHALPDFADIHDPASRCAGHSDACPDDDDETDTKKRANYFRANRGHNYLPEVLSRKVTNKGPAKMCASAQ